MVFWRSNVGMQTIVSREEGLSRHKKNFGINGMFGYDFTGVFNILLGMNNKEREKGKPEA